jgi:PAS domain S-box-containing protein
MNGSEAVSYEGANLRDRIAALEASLAERMGIVQELRESEERFRTLLENSPDSITVLDEHGTILYLNRGAQQPAEDILGTSSVAYIVKEGAERFLAAIAAALRTGEPQTVEVETVTHRRWQTRLVPLGTSQRVSQCS